MKQRPSNILIFFTLLLLPFPAFAYLDAGTGSQILQIIVATCIGAAFVFKAGWQKIRALFKKIFSKNANDTKGKQ